MTLDDFKKLNLPDGPGVYFFKKTVQAIQKSQKAQQGDTPEIQSQPETLYIGKATSLRDRVRSYFNDDLIKTRGRLLVDMVALADTITYQETDSVLEAFILESELIKQYLPRYNTKEKDNKSFNYVVITKEDFPRVLVVRGRNLEKAGSTKQEQIDTLGFEYTDVFGPFPFGAELKEAMKLIRRIFPYRDTCTPYIHTPHTYNQKSISSDGARINIVGNEKMGKPCFNRSIGLCPGVCTGEMNQEEYAVQISHIRTFFKGKKYAVVADLKKQMLTLADEQRFEEAGEIKKTIGALAHIHDISMVKKDAQFGHAGKRDMTEVHIRAEVYDIAHMSGKDMVGVMVVMHNDDFAKDQYKKFTLRGIKDANDTGALKQVLERRFSHIFDADADAKWPIPTHIVLDGGIAQMNTAETVLNDVLKEIDKNSPLFSKISNITLVAVTKDETHNAKEIRRSTNFVGDNKVVFDDGDIISINQECHRFAIATHRKRRSLSRGL